MARERKFSTEELFHATKQLLPTTGYDGFTFSALADYLGVSRGAIYKYYENKDELITEFMLYEMNEYLVELKKIETIVGFDEQFNYLLDLMFKDSKIHQIIVMGPHIKVQANKNSKENIKKLESLHLEMYKILQEFIQQGRKEKKLKDHVPDELILGFIFQSITIPNHFHIPYDKWIHSLKDMIKDGVYGSE